MEWPQNTAHQRISPIRMGVANLSQETEETRHADSEKLIGVLDSQPVGNATIKPPNDEKAVCSRAPFREHADRQIARPASYRGDELDTHTDKGRGAKEQQHRKTGRIHQQQMPRSSINQNAPGEYPTSPQSVGEIATNQAKDTATDCWNIEQ